MPLTIMVAYTTNVPVLVHKHTKLARLMERLTAVKNMTDNFSAMTADNAEYEIFVNGVSIYKGKVDKNGQIWQHQEV